MTDSTPTKRPGVITLISILLWIQALVAGVAALVLFLNRDDPDFQTLHDQNPESLLSSAFIESVTAVLLITAAIGLLRGSMAGRTLVAVIMAARIGTGIWHMMYNSGNLVIVSAIGILISIFVLWALYDHKDSRSYFIY